MQAKTTTYPSISKSYNGDITAINTVYVNGKGWQEYNRPILTDREFQTVIRHLKTEDVTVVNLRIVEPLAGESNSDFKVSELMPDTPEQTRLQREAQFELVRRPDMAKLSKHYWKNRLRCVNHAIKSAKCLEDYTNGEIHPYKISRVTVNTFVSEMELEAEVINQYLKSL